jgi:DNA-binding winged helix-turn-helix (wHTH) protein
MLIIVLIAAGAFINKKDENPEQHAEIVLRDIGHQLLLAAKDSSSRVLPVKKLNENTYQVSFQNNVGFISDSLINIVERAFQKNPLAKDYIVNLRNCKQNETVFAFELNGKAGNLTPCRGRKLELGCYVIEIHLLNSASFNFFWWLLLLIPLGLAVFYMNKTFRKKEAKEEKEENEKDEEKESAAWNNEYIPLGSFRFYAADNLLKTADKTIVLSEKETKALKIFAENINEIVEREQLMKAIWEEEGVVVISRNVDVLVSKLRKKLSDDTTLKFINVHGKGYKFVIE